MDEELEGGIGGILGIDTPLLAKSGAGDQVAVTAIAQAHRLGFLPDRFIHDAVKDEGSRDRAGPDGIGTLVFGRGPAGQGGIGIHKTPGRAGIPAAFAHEPDALAIIIGGVGKIVAVEKGGADEEIALEQARFVAEGLQIDGDLNQIAGIDVVIVIDGGAGFQGDRGSSHFHAVDDHTQIVTPKRAAGRIQAHGQFAAQEVVVVGIAFGDVVDDEADAVPLIIGLVGPDRLIADIGGEIEHILAGEPLEGGIGRVEDRGLDTADLRLPLTGEQGGDAGIGGAQFVIAETEIDPRGVRPGGFIQYAVDRRHGVCVRIGDDEIGADVGQSAGQGDARVGVDLQHGVGGVVAPGALNPDAVRTVFVLVQRPEPVAVIDGKVEGDDRPLSGGGVIAAHGEVEFEFGDVALVGGRIVIGDAVDHCDRVPDRAVGGGPAEKAGGGADVGGVGIGPALGHPAVKILEGAGRAPGISGVADVHQHGVKFGPRAATDRRVGGDNRQIETVALDQELEGGVRRVGGIDAAFLGIAAARDRAGFLAVDDMKRLGLSPGGFTEDAVEGDRGITGASPDHIGARNRLAVRCQAEKQQQRKGKQPEVLFLVHVSSQS